MIRIVERHDSKRIFYYTKYKTKDAKPYYFEINKEIKLIYIYLLVIYYNA